jgi:hypothetical protein
VRIQFVRVRQRRASIAAPNARAPEGPNSGLKPTDIVAMLRLDLDGLGKSRIRS